MNTKTLRRPAAWPTSPDEARRLQSVLRSRVVTTDRLGPVRYIAGLDAHEAPPEGRMYAAAALLRYPDLALVEATFAVQRVTFPYIPGLLSFREAPVMLAALAKLRTRPDLLFVDGQGIAHPRRLGIAAHIGLLADIPAIGAAKSRLVGRYVEPEPMRGAWSPLMIGDQIVGAVLRTRVSTRPIYVSVGHRISLETAIVYVLACAPRYRIPEPTRVADRLSRLHRTDDLPSGFGLS
ncbi:MAG TPA: deoxyribonuclease V [Alphaproteobacteria bacterium]